MDSSNIVSITPANWITILIIVSVSFAILGAVTRIYQQKKATS